MPTGKESINIFFAGFGISLIITAIKVNLVGLPPEEALKLFVITYLWNFLSNIPGALALMAGVDYYHYLKKI